MTSLNSERTRTFSGEQISKTRNFDADLILRQNMFDLMSRFMEKKSTTPT